MIRMHLNENVFTYDSPVNDSLMGCFNTICLYPDIKYSSLKNKLANWLGVRQEQLVIGNGSSELIHRIYMEISERKGRVIFPWPSYVLYSEMETLSGIPAIKVPLGEEKQIDLEAVLRHIDDETKLIILCNPNNPTGSVFTGNDLRGFLEYIPKQVMVLVDEAYIDYINDISNYSAISLVDKWSNLVVIKTFSKLYGMAALRLGYAICSSEKALWLQNRLPNWNINQFAEVALASCINNPEFFSKVRENVRIEREWLSEQLNDLGFKTVPSNTNFIFVFDSDISDIKNMLEKNGILVKRIADIDYEAIRVTVGRRSDNEKLIEKLKTAAMEVINR